ncbi:hypothetical protein ACFL6S_04815 [Candidatus Poribacteria bacterium]
MRAHEDEDVVKIRRFVTTCLESVGALVEFPRYNYAEVVIPDEFADYFDGENYFNLSFDFDVAKDHEDSELVTYGSYFLDRVFDLASQRGLTCKKHIIDENVEIRNLDQKMKGKITFRNCRSSFVANAPIIYHYMLFNFKVSYISDERVDRIVRVLVNLNTGHVDTNMLKAVGSAFFTDDPHTNYTVEQTRPVDDAYRAATVALEEQIQPTIHELSGKIRRRLAGEKNRIMEYYDQTDGELNLKRDRLVQSDRTEGLKSIDDKLRLSEIERQRRLNEIEEKNALKVSVMLFSASQISQTKIRNRYSVKRGKAERDVYIVWNPALNSVEPLACEICDSETTKMELCSNAHLGCTACVRTCSVCAAHLCTDCGMTECAVCGDPLCDDCKIVCENCGDVLCEKHVEHCTCKEEKRRKTEEKARKKRKAEEEAKEEYMLEFLGAVRGFPESMKQYHDKYVRSHIDALDQNWKDLISDAQRAIPQKDKTKVRAILRRLDAEYPANAWVKSNLVLSYKRLSEEIASMAREAVRLAPRMALTHTAMAYIHDDNYDFEAALKSYDQVIRLSGNDETDFKTRALLLSGQILNRNGNWDEAERRWEMALEIDPYFTPAHQALAQMRRWSWY